VEKVSGYHRQARVENAFVRYTTVIGEIRDARTERLRLKAVEFSCSKTYLPIPSAASQANLAAPATLPLERLSGLA